MWRLSIGRLWVGCALLAMGCLGLGAPASAHEVRPAYLTITETVPESYRIRWKQPTRGTAALVRGLGLKPVFPVNCRYAEAPVQTYRPGSLTETLVLNCVGGLEGQVLAVEGLQKTITDVFVQVTPYQGDAFHLRLTPGRPQAQLAGSNLSVLPYFALGFEHLVFGYDHILFVIGLVMLVSGWRRLALVVTGFTLAHSLTLALSVLGLVRLPMAATEAVIALSILYVAVELARDPAQRTGLAHRAPYAIAFGFGLLHGFGFAGVIVDIGLPRGDTALALLFFNLGLEAGQMALVGALLVVGHVAAKKPRLAERGAAIVIVVMGGVSLFWLLTRLRDIVIL